MLSAKCFNDCPQTFLKQKKCTNINIHVLAEHFSVERPSGDLSTGFRVSKQVSRLLSSSDDLVLLTRLKRCANGNTIPVSRGLAN